MLLTLPKSYYICVCRVTETLPVLIFYTYKYVKISRRTELQTHHCAQILYNKMPYVGRPSAM